MTADMRVAFVCLAVAVAAGCGSASPPATGGNGGNGGMQDSTADAGAGSAVDLADGPDLAPRPLPPDLGSTDLAGVVNCFGATVCDPTSSFCIRLNSSTAWAPT